MRGSPVYSFAVAGVLALASMLALFEPNPVPRIREIVFDAYLNWAEHSEASDSKVKIVAIDDKSIEQLGQWPWPRHKLAILTQKLADAGAATIAYDIIFSEADQSSPYHEVSRQLATSGAIIEGSASQNLPSAHDMRSHDIVFARILKQAPVVLALTGTNTAKTEQSADSPDNSGIAVAGDNPIDLLPQFSNVIMPIRELRQAASGLGAINWNPDGDNVIRKVPTIIAIGGKLYPSLALEALRVATGAGTIMIKTSNASGQTAFGVNSGINTIRVGEHIIDTEFNGEIRLLAHKVEPDRFISASSVFDGTFSPDMIKGNIIFVGVVAASLHDQIAIPTAISIPGVEVHAQIAEQILAGTKLVRPDWMRGFESFLILVLGSIFALLLRKTKQRPVFSIIAGLTLPALLGIGSWLSFRYGGLLFDPVIPSVGLLCTYLTASIYHYQESERHRSEIHKMFGRFVSPVIVEHLAKAPEKIDLGGTRRELTIMFTDIRDFTELSETASPESSVALLRRIHTTGTSAVLEHKGTIDKFMGDGMMAFWNAPLHTPGHARLACLAALHIIQESRNLCSPAIRMGIGIHTGNACVGNLGSEQRLEYSALGDAVNLASRIEALTKNFGVEIIVSEETVKQAGDLPFFEIDYLAVKGRKTPVRLFALHTGPNDDAFLRLRKAQEELMSSYQAGLFADAAEILSGNTAIYEGTYANLQSYYFSLFKTLEVKPDLNWKGFHIL